MDPFDVLMYALSQVTANCYFLRLFLKCIYKNNTELDASTWTKIPHLWENSTVFLNYH